MVKEIEKAKVAIVTGGATGIGLEIVKELVNNNYNVILNYNRSKAEANEVSKNFDNIKIYQADVSKSNEVKNLVNFAIEKFEKIDLLVNNAGIDMFKTLTEMISII